MIANCAKIVFFTFLFIGSLHSKSLDFAIDPFNKLYNGSEKIIVTGKILDIKEKRRSNKKINLVAYYPDEKTKCPVVIDGDKFSIQTPQQTFLRGSSTQALEKILGQKRER